MKLHRRIRSGLWLQEGSLRLFHHACTLPSGRDTQDTARSPVSPVGRPERSRQHCWAAGTGPIRRTQPIVPYNRCEDRTVRLVRATLAEDVRREPGRLLLCVLSLYGFLTARTASANIRAVREAAQRGDAKAQRHFTQTRYARV